MTVTYTLINKCAPGMCPINYGRKLVKNAADILYSIGVDNRKDVRAELDDLQNTIRMLLDSIEQMEIADEQAAGDVDD
ncbi:MULTISPECIES: hypothetical protein [Pseudomonas syringae group]|nr:MULTISPECIES: hypothetical protein [Pseudomonas syringae group]KPY34292.1 Uncharacterized protein ALO65_00784 [Pseudomonas syringae pv. papulans]KWS31330.1 hypothetical protein AL059_17020 [Pseudomonas syringae pv. papulans]MDH4606625.1 hypothetical protein [Pseudomonas syringae pv. papulans]MDH4624917.1 hypothetical protein [Pseudomonas syringae pv. papulans]PHN72530.1 hypothetical protein AO286_23770 [Pseudomonas syringae]